MDSPEIRVRTWIKGGDADAATGLLGYLSVTYGSMVLDGIVLRRTVDGRFALSFPARTDRSGRRHRSSDAEIVRKDAAYAGLIPQRSPTHRRVDFHCLRKSCARILIELNVHPKVIQQPLRHADIRLTMDLYGELGEDDLFRELPGKFPVPQMFAMTSKGTAREGATAKLVP